MTFAGIESDEPRPGARPTIEPLAHGPLPPALQAAVAASLDARERVLWLGRPGRAAAGGLGHGLAGLALLALAGVAVLFARDTLDSLNVDWRLPWLREGALLGSGLALAAPAALLAAVSADVLARPGRRRRLLRRVAYVVTTARALLVVAGPAAPQDAAPQDAAPRVRKYRRAAMRRAALRPREAGRGDVLLRSAANEADPLLCQLLAGRDGFRDVERAAEVADLFRRVANAKARAAD